MIPTYLFQSLWVSEPDNVQEATQCKTPDIFPQQQAAVCRHPHPYVERKYFFFLEQASYRDAILLATEMTFPVITQNSLAPPATASQTPPFQIMACDLDLHNGKAMQ